MHIWCMYGEYMVHVWCMLTLDTQPLPVAVPLVDKSTPQADHLDEPTRPGEGTHGEQIAVPLVDKSSPRTGRIDKIRRGKTRNKGILAGSMSSCELQAKCTRALPHRTTKDVGRLSRLCKPGALRSSCGGPHVLRRRESGKRLSSRRDAP